MSLSDLQRFQTALDAVSADTDAASSLMTIAQQLEQELGAFPLAPCRDFTSSCMMATQQGLQILTTCLRDELVFIRMQRSRGLEPVVGLGVLAAMTAHLPDGEEAGLACMQHLTACGLLCRKFDLMVLTGRDA